MLKRLFFLLLVRPLVVLGMGLHLRGGSNLPQEGPCIIVANHNSHLDTLILMSLLPISVVERVRPVAAADYFLKNRFMKWFALNLMGIIPITRQVKASKEHPLHEAIEALGVREILIIFPEGSRGEPEQMGRFKNGVAHLAKLFPEVPVIPVGIYGAGKSLPKGEALFVPFIADVCVGEALFFGEEKVTEFTEKLETSISSMHPHENNHKGEGYE